VRWSGIFLELVDLINGSLRSGRNVDVRYSRVRQKILQEDFMKIILMVAAVFSALALADISAQQWGSSQIDASNVTDTKTLPYLLTMGPDPGGHTGATVTPETSKTGQSAVDSARQAASGSSTEKSGPPVDSAQQAKKQ
jgi:hypothetical protein